MNHHDSMIIIQRYAPAPAGSAQPANSSSSCLLVESLLNHFFVNLTYLTFSCGEANHEPFPRGHGCWVMASSPWPYGHPTASSPWLYQPRTSGRWRSFTSSWEAIVTQATDFFFRLKFSKTTWGFTDSKKKSSTWLKNMMTWDRWDIPSAGGFFWGSQSWGAEPGLPGDGTLEDTWARKWLGKLWKTMENPRKFGDSISFLFRQMSNQILSLTSFKWQEMLYDYPGEIGNDQQGDIIKNLRKLNTTVWISWKRLIFLTMKNAHSHPCINNCLSTELCSPVQG